MTIFRPGKRQTFRRHDNYPTYVDDEHRLQIPGPLPGNSVGGLPPDVDAAYREARACISVSAFTAAALVCRKILMHVAVEKGAAPGDKFAAYVQFLVDRHFVPPGAEPWVDHIRDKGNEATHELPAVSADDANEVLVFVENLLRFIYELPARMKSKSSSPSSP